MIWERVKWFLREVCRCSSINEKHTVSAVDDAIEL